MDEEIYKEALFYRYGKGIINLDTSPPQRSWEDVARLTGLGSWDELRTKAI